MNSTTLSQADMTCVLRGGRGGYTVLITRQTEACVSATVAGEHGAYETTLSRSGSTCSCKDSLFRGGRIGPCKHATAAAIHLLAS